MGTYKGTSAADTITPDEITGGVGRVPAGSFPSTDADAIDGRRGNDILDGGGGADTIRGGGGDDEIGDNVGRGQAGVDLDTPNAGNVIHGDAGNDEIRIEGRDAGGENPFGNTAYGDGGRDLIEFIFYGDLDQGVNSGRSPTGAIVGSGGAGSDTLRVDSVAIQPTDLTVTLKGGAGADKLSATAWIVEYDGSAMGGDNPDRLVGGTGDDVYEVYEQKDLVVERPNEGYDTVVARDTDYTLPSDVEKLEMNAGDLWHRSRGSARGGQRPRQPHPRVGSDGRRAAAGRRRRRRRDLRRNVCRRDRRRRRQRHPLRQARRPGRHATPTRFAAAPATTRSTAGSGSTIEPTPRMKSMATPATTTSGLAAATTWPTAATATTISTARATTTPCGAARATTASTAAPARIRCMETRAATTSAAAPGWTSATAAPGMTATTTMTSPTPRPAKRTAT